VDFLGFSGGRGLFSHKRLSPLEKIAKLFAGFAECNAPSISSLATIAQLSLTITAAHYDRRLGLIKFQ
jgi:hypothetical protein